MDGNFNNMGMMGMGGGNMGGGGGGGGGPKKAVHVKVSKPRCGFLLMGY